jgi:hypothetical protein
MPGPTPFPGAPSPGPVGVAEGAIRGDPIADELLQLLELGEPPAIGARPERDVVERDLEHSLVAGPQRHLGELALEGHEELLRHPGGAEQPPAAGAIGDADDGHAPPDYGLICTGVPSGTACQISSISWLDRATQPFVQSFWR